MIHYTCPRCGQEHQAPEIATGTKHACVECGQRVLIPPPVRLGKTTPHPAANKTRLGQIDRKSVPVAEVVAAEAVNVPLLQRARPRRQRRPDPGTDDCCPECGGELVIKTETTPLGWLLFGILFLLMPLLCWVGFFIRSRWLVCSECDEQVECLNQFWVGG